MANHSSDDLTGQDCRCKAMQIPDYLLAGILRGELRITNLPADATIKRGYYNFQTFCVEVAIHSSQFENVPVGVAMPTFLAEVTRVQSFLENPHLNPAYLRAVAADAEAR